MEAQGPDPAQIAGSTGKVLLSFERPTREAVWGVPPAWQDRRHKPQLKRQSASEAVIHLTGARCRKPCHASLWDFKATCFVYNMKVCSCASLLAQLFKIIITKNFIQNNFLNYLRIYLAKDVKDMSVEWQTLPMQKILKKETAEDSWWWKVHATGLAELLLKYLYYIQQN